MYTAGNQRCPLALQGVIQLACIVIGARGKQGGGLGCHPERNVIDECHRGGANDESNWRASLEYFAPAVQLGLTATPKRKDNVDTYAYFGEPVYVYSLKEGINDGFLTPFKVKQISTTLDEYVYTPDDRLVEGKVERGRRYTEATSTRSSRSESGKPTG